MKSLLTTKAERMVNNTKQLKEGAPRKRNERIKKTTIYPSTLTNHDRDDTDRLNILH